MGDAERRFVCSTCHGAGEQASLDDYERERDITDFCYHCGGSGQVDADTDFHDRVHAMASQVAAKRVREWINRAGRDVDDGFDVHLAAAENGQSLHDWTTERIWAETDRVEKKLGELSQVELAAMLAGYEAASNTNHDRR